VASGKKTAEASAERFVIRSKSALLAAIGEIDDLLSRSRRSQAESRRLEELSDAVRAYEQKNLPVAERSIAQRLRYLLEIHGVGVAEIAETAGISQASLTGVLRGTAKFNQEEAERLGKHFGLEPATFLDASD
jgi:antitoxin component HigA of HigAB toxin-antitoxin module